ncbi:hypothetical protein PGIGA_G00096670 [Pangasianodon gigas]|uniref:Uncharacterized protein n=1 Tax=Pangasianodon gigas TaxID=30993 RepID=A0ACC5XDC7_PANGG|nr:hypothetical protein [Pangasianodon gigas]
MPLTKEEGIEIILMAGSGSCRKVEMEFNRKHGKHITHDTVAKPINKFKKTRSVVDQLRSGRPRTSTDEDTADVVLEHIVPYVCTEDLQWKYSQGKHRTEWRGQNSSQYAYLTLT